MKNLLRLFVVLLTTQTLSAQTIFQYDFASDTVGKALNGHNGWSNNSSDGYPGIGGSVSGDAPVKRDTLSYNGFYTSYKGLDLIKADGVGHFITFTNTLPNTALPAYVATDKLYAAFLFKPSTAVSDSGGTSVGQIFRLYGKDKFSSDVVASRLLVQKLGSKVRFGIDKNGGTAFTSFNYDVNKTHLIVMKYSNADSLASNNDTTSLFVNPSVIGNEPAPLAFTKVGSDANITKFVAYLNNPAITGNSFGTLGAIKITRNWVNLFSTVATIDVKSGILKVYPTLATDRITLELTDKTPSVSTIKIVNLNGQIVYSDKLLINEMYKTLNINDLAKGLYLISIQNENFITTQKFIKQ